MAFRTEDQFKGSWLAWRRFGRSTSRLSSPGPETGSESKEGAALSRNKVGLEKARITRVAHTR